MKKHLKIHALAAIILLAVLSGCRQQEAAKVRIAVVAQTAFTSLPVTVAQALGYFKEENLDVTLDDVAGPSAAIQSLSGNSAEVAAAIFDVLLLAGSEGKQFRSFALMSNSPGLAIVVSPIKAGEIRTVEDLRGRSIGISSLGSSADIYVRYIASRHQLAAQDIKVVALGSAQARLAKLETGEVDAAVISEPGISILRRKHGHVSLLADSRTGTGMQDWFGVSEYPGTVVFSTPEWLAKNPDTARKLAHAVVRAQRWMHARTPADITDEISKKLPEFVKPDREAFLEGLTSSIPSYSMDGKLNEEAVRKAIEVVGVFAEKVHERPIDLKSIFTNEYLPR